MESSPATTSNTASIIKLGTMAKTDAERQRTLTAKRKREGWKRIWIPANLVAKVKELLQEEKK